MAAAYGHTKATVVRVDAAAPARPPRGARDRAHGRGEARLLRAAAHRLPLGPAGVQPLVREPAPARDRPCDGDEPAAAAARRAGRGHEPRRDARDHRADRRACATKAGTRSSSSSTTCTWSRASPTGSSRSTTASRSPRARSSRWRPTERWSRRTSGSGEGDVSATDGTCSLRALRRRHVLRRDPHPPGRRARGRRGRARLPPGRQRVREVDDAEDDPRHRPAAHGHGRRSTART